MKLHTLNYSCLLNASSDKVCDFHTDTANLIRITPPWIDVKIISADLHIKEKSRIVLKIKRFALSTLWEMEIEKLEAPLILIDSMISGPFRFFRHQRHFIPLENGETLMREIISFALHIGWLGNLLFPLIKRDMDKMFEYRHCATQEYFLKGA